MQRYNYYSAEAQCLISLGPISSQPLAFVGSEHQKLLYLRIILRRKCKMEEWEEYPGLVETRIQGTDSVSED